MTKYNIIRQPHAPASRHTTLYEDALVLSDLQVGYRLIFNYGEHRQVVTTPIEAIISNLLGETQLVTANSTYTIRKV